MAAIPNWSSPNLSKLLNIRAFLCSTYNKFASLLANSYQSKMPENYDPPTTWTDLVAFQSRLQNCPKNISRSIITFYLYLFYRKIIPKNWRHDRILRQIGNHQYRLLANDFPYDRLLKNLPYVKQFVLWSKTGPLTSHRISEIIKTSFPKAQFFYYENIPSNKSIPDIWHVHVFVNTKI
jgi:hypothetical protein